MRVLQIGSDRSKRGIHVRGSSAYLRQKAYAEKFGALDIIGYTRRKDGFRDIHDGSLGIYPTKSPIKLLYGTNALLIARCLQKPDVVSAQDPHDCGLLALWIARMRGVPLHVQMHSDIISASYGFHSPINFIRFHIALFVLKRADGIRVVSDRIRKSIEKRITPKRPITMLPIFVDVEKFRNAVPDAALASKFARFTTKLLFVGRLEAEKDAGLTIRSFAEVAPADACLIIVGDGSERAMLEKFVKELHIADRVFFEGERDSLPYHKIADLLLVTSHYEGYGLVIIEALASGTPVLSTDVGIAREAGAIVAEDFTVSLAQWFTDGPRTAALTSYPYRTFDEYVAKYCDDIKACVVPK